MPEAIAVMPSWSFLSNHGAVLILIASQPQITSVEIGSQLGITECPVRRITSEMKTAGYLRRRMEGRVNCYDVNPSLLLPKPVLKNMAAGDLLGILRSISDLPSGSQPEVDLKNLRSNSPSFRPVESTRPSAFQLSGEPRFNGTDSLTRTS